MSVHPGWIPGEGTVPLTISIRRKAAKSGGTGSTGTGSCGIILLLELTAGTTVLKS